MKFIHRIRSALVSPSDQSSSGKLRRPAWALAVLAVGLLTLASLYPVLEVEGWIENHDQLAWKDRTLIYAHHLEEGDYVPVWSTRSATGLGSPYPVFYHRTQTYLAALLYLATDSMKAATVGSLLVFSWLGVAGAALAARRLGLGWLAALALGACLPWLNYSLTNWAVRGAMAEYSAACVAPWVYYWCLAALHGDRPRRLALLGAFVFPFLYYSHSLIFFLSAVPVLLALGWRLVKEPARGRLPLVLWMGALGAWAALWLGPTLLLQAAFNDNLAFRERFLVLNPTGQFIEWTRYFVDHAFSWGEGMAGKRPKHTYTVQLDWALLLPALAGALALAWWRWRRPPDGSARERRGPYAWFVLICTLWFVLLQLPLARPLYAHVPGFAYMQFPWRALTHLTVLELLLAALVGRHLLHAWSPRLVNAGALATLLLVVAFSPAWRVDRPEIARENLEKPFFHGIPVYVGGTLEYFPKIEDMGGYDHVAKFIWDTYAPDPWDRHWSTPAYRTAVHWVGSPESLVHRLEFWVEEPTVGVAPYAWSGWERVERIEADGSRTRLPAWRLPSDPRLHFNLEPGHYFVEIRFPTLGRMIAQAWEGAQADDPK